MFQRVAILGLGAVGGSIGLALRQAKAAQQVTGYDSGKGIAGRAHKLGAIDAACTQVAEAVREAELIVLAAPIGEMRALLQQIASAAPKAAVVTDVASAKAQVISWAEEFLPSSQSFVGGHPINEKEAEGIDAAQVTLFQQRIYCLVPTRRTHPAALEKVSTLVETLGGTVRFLEPAEHDSMIAATQQLPFLVSTALIQTVGSSPSWHDARLLAGDGLRAITSLASGDPTSHRDSLLANSDQLVRCINDYMKHLGELRDRIASRDGSIDNLFRQAQKMWDE
ncbi:MAG TPA: prephenate dehydrogenase [Ktedonobacteraceae bacterium]|nr:prephenate dehydrogenase [Ktedonobacteraceae bacterium]